MYPDNMPAHKEADGGFTLFTAFHPTSRYSIQWQNGTLLNKWLMTACSEFAKWHSNGLQPHEK